jgi:hypothetical protein
VLTLEVFGGLGHLGVCFTALAWGRWATSVYVKGEGQCSLADGDCRSLHSLQNWGLSIAWSPIFLNFFTQILKPRIVLEVTTLKLMLLFDMTWVYDKSFRRDFRAHLFQPPTQTWSSLCGTSARWLSASDGPL